MSAADAAERRAEAARWLAIADQDLAYRYPPEEEGDTAPPPADILRRIGEIEGLRQAGAAGIGARG